MIKVSDYIIQRLVDYGVKHIFMISGGGAMHLVDSIGKNKKVEYICNHHEQASAIAAEGYARISGQMAVVVVTSGPGSTNTLTGVIGQWLDSIPVLYLSGQVKYETTIESCRHLGLRQLGDQEINIVDIVRPVTKYAAMIRDPDKIRWYLEKAIYLATHGRPGPVWLDVPLDVQAAIIDETKLQIYKNKESEIRFNRAVLSEQIRQVVEVLKRAQRPVFLAGQGIRISGSQKLFRDFIEEIGMPVLTTFCGFDLIPSDHPLFVGRPGTVATRFGNFALQNADVLLSVGSRNNIRQVSYNWRTFARCAIKIIVDIDTAELNKPTLKPDIAIHADAGDFFREIQLQIKNVKLPSWEQWRQWCLERKIRYPVVLPEYWQTEQLVNPYCFMETLTQVLSKNALMVAGNGTACVTLFQAGIVRESQRIFWNSGCASMGYALPAAIGACFASEKKPVVCLEGDGSLQMNIQELQTVVYHKLPIKLFVLNNNGYISIRQTQDAFFNGRRVGCDSESGVGFPDVIKVGRAYGLAVAKIGEHNKMKEKIKQVLKTPGPVVCEVCLLPNQKFSPKTVSEKKPDGRMISKPLEDMYPFLPRKEFYHNMIIEPLPDK